MASASATCLQRYATDVRILCGRFDGVPHMLQLLRTGMGQSLPLPPRWRFRIGRQRTSGVRTKPWAGDRLPRREHRDVFYSAAVSLANNGLSRVNT